MTCPECQQDNPSHAKFCLECGVLLRSTSEGGPSVPPHAELQRALTEALEQQTATSEILRVISSSPTDVQPVFDAIAQSARRLCDGNYSTVVRFDGAELHMAASAHIGVKGVEAMERHAGLPRRTMALGRAILDAATVHIPDALADPEYDRSVADAVRLRSIVAVPMLRHGVPIGAISVSREQLRPFSETQIDLLKTFADQAVIAIENVRLFKELEARNHDLTRALDQQTATSDILRVISGARTDLQPVFDAIVESALRLLKGYGGTLTQLTGDHLELGAVTSIDPAGDTALRARFPQPLAVEGPHTYTIRKRVPLNIADAHSDPRFPTLHALSRVRGLRSQVVVPMLRHDETIGTISVTRREPGGFTDDEIALLQTFADQAVIAIENVRLFNETKEALEQQTATSEILRVISSSPTDLQPVFEAILRSALQLCAGFYSLLFLCDGEQLDLVATHNVPPEGLEALRGRYPLSIASDEAGLSAQAVRERRLQHVKDIQTESSIPEAARRASQVVGQRAGVAVPLLREGEPVGVLTVSRQEARVFAEKELALLQTFADQAVIAIENVRLFTELQTSNRELTTALDTQTATSDILQVISGSRTDVQPVFDAIVTSAVRLIGGFSAVVVLAVGEELQLAAETTTDDSGHAALHAYYPVRIDASGTLARVIRERVVWTVDDTESDPTMTARQRDLARARRWRSNVVVPIVRENESEAIGLISVTRREARPSTPEERALLKTFADQAVIAIENVRLFTELEARNRDLGEALEQQTATSGILGVIASSPTDIQPVLDAVAESAARLCDSFDAEIFRREGDQLLLVAHHGPIPSRTLVVPLVREAFNGRTVLDGHTFHVADLQAETEEFRRGSQIARQHGTRAQLSVPLMREGVVIGTISLRRTEARLFTERQVALLQTFADQAVIAIENVRLFKELEARNRDLTTALDTQTATSDILRVISMSQTEVQPVFDAILASGVRLCGARFGSVFRFDGELIHLVASYEWPAEQLEVVRRRFPMPPGDSSLAARAIRDRRVVQTPDYVADSQAGTWPEWVPGGEQRPRSTIAIPMLREGNPVGAIALARSEPGLFSDQHIALLQTFADQAVIAIENVRLFTELGQRNQDLTQALEQQTATAEVLRVIGSSPTDTQPVFDAIVSSARRLLDGFSGGVYRRVGDEVHIAAYTSTTPAGDAAVRSLYPRPLAVYSFSGEAIRAGTVIVSTDIETDPRIGPEWRAAIRVRGFRSGIWVPMLRESGAIGAIGVTRAEPGSFSDEQIALLKTFADQAVIAIENVRLFTELEARNRDLTAALDRQTATADILGVISQSQTDAQPVFDAIVDNAMRLFRAWAAAIVQLDGQLLHLIAVQGGRPGLDQYLREQSPWSIHGPTPVARSVVERTVIHIPDTESDRLADEEIQEIRRRGGMRSVLAAPMLRDGHPIGGIWISRAEAGSFSPAEIALLRTFADQAVIAIENTRLLGELQARTQELGRSVGELQALGEVSQAVSSTLDLQTVLTTIVARATLLAGADAGIIYEYDDEGEIFRPRATERLEPEVVEVLVTAPVRKGEGATGQLAVLREPVQLSDIHIDYLPSLHHARDAFVRAGYRALLAVPLLREGHLIGGLTVMRKMPGEFPRETIELLRTFATQSFLAIQNARLFHEIEDKSRQLEAASRHKSEFLANMSHELRTPLNAIIGFSEVLNERMFGELNEKQDEYLKDIYASGQHLLSLINDILDLSKIEAGRMELELADFSLPAAIDNALTLVRERASRHGITLGQSIDDRVGVIRGDERKVKQVLLNLLSNALKFTPEGGRIDVRAAVNDGMAEISVADTGVGIAPEDQEAIFEEFRQVGTADKKVEGTGLGLALSRKFIELHGGRIWVKSQSGEGSTFTFTLPVGHGE